MNASINRHRYIFICLLRNAYLYINFLFQHNFRLPEKLKNSIRNLEFPCTFHLDSPNITIYLACVARYISSRHDARLSLITEVCVS